MKLAEQLRIMPFVRIFAALAAGILTARFVTAPDWVVFSLAAAVYAAAWAFRHKPWGQAYLLGTVWMTGIVLSVLSDTPQTMPRGERLTMVVRVQENPLTQGRWQRTTARIGYFRADPSSGNPAADSVWQPCRETIQLYADTSQHIAAGETFSMRGYLNPIDTAGTSYGRLMRSRGLSARTYLTPGNLIARMQSDGKSLALRAASVQGWAVQRLARLRLDSTERNLVTTLVAGERRGLDRKLRADYARVGVSHILSVSGLHMGFILILVNLLSGWIVMFRRGHLIRNALVIAALWVYAVMAGLSPPVIRAALTMSTAQLAFGLSARADRYNLLLGAATLMLAVNPHYLFDISFQLSFLAVLSILFLYPRLYRLRLSKNRGIDYLWSSILLGLAAQIGTLPLVAYSFGNIPLIALLINPAVVLCSFVVVSAGFLWLLLPLEVLNPLLSEIISGALWLQNSLIGWAAELPGAAIDQLRPGGWWVAGLYGVMIGAAVAWKKREEKRRPALQS